MGNLVSGLLAALGCGRFIIQVIQYLSDHHQIFNTGDRFNSTTALLTFSSYYSFSKAFVILFSACVTLAACLTNADRVPDFRDRMADLRLPSTERGPVDSSHGFRLLIQLRIDCFLSCVHDSAVAPRGILFSQ